MQRFAQLLDDLYFTNASLAKQAILKDYLSNTPDPDRGWALAAIAGTLRFDLFKRSLTMNLMRERMDNYLFDLSRDYVGELSETVALAWRPREDSVRLNRLPDLTEVIHEFTSRDKAGIREYLILLLDNMTPPQRWALLKLGTRGLRIGLSARTVKRVIADMAGVDIEEIEELWHGLEPPYESLFAWIEGRADKPDISDVITYTPVMLAHPIEERDFDRISGDTHIAEYKFDGIRVQISAQNGEAKLFSRTGDDISHSFPDLMEAVNFDGVIDGELLVRPEGKIGAFNDLQQRLNKKKPSKSIMERLPAYVIAYDALKLGGEDLRNQPLTERREKLSALMEQLDDSRFSLSRLLPFATQEELSEHHKAAGQSDGILEGLMIKAKDSVYVSGRPKHQWYKWKREPYLLDAVLMYAQRGTGKRSSYYSDYTFGLWDPEGMLLPIGKAYFGFTDDELKQLDNWIRRNKQQRFGPVQEVKKELVFEVAFDSAHESKRHKSGYALRFPRISRIRWDKPAKEADRIEALAKIVSGELA